MQTMGHKKADKRRALHSHIESITTKCHCIPHPTQSQSQSQTNGSMEGLTNVYARLSQYKQIFRWATSILEPMVIFQKIFVAGLIVHATLSRRATRLISV